MMLPESGRLSYDMDLNAMTVDMSSIRLADKKMVDLVFQEIHTYLDTLSGQPYYLVDLQDFTVASRAVADYYGIYVERLIPRVLTIIRYGAMDPLNKQHVQAQASSHHYPTNLCAGREDALEIVRQLTSLSGR